MAIFEQRCKQCGHRFEVIAIGKRCRRACPNCGSRRVEQLASVFVSRTAAPGPSLSIDKRGAAHNPFENLTLRHVRDEHGRPVTVNSERELRAAEKKWGFIHAASWGLADRPPVHDPGAGDITRNYKRKWNHDPDAYKPENVTGVSAGVTPERTAKQLAKGTRAAPSKQPEMPPTLPGQTKSRLIHV